MTLQKMAESLRQIALAYPETYEESPWGDRVVKVRGKIFFSCGVHEGKLYATVKVPQSGRALLQRKYAEPTHYGMGKHGWVTLKLAAVEQVPVDELRTWIDESFRAVAPKKLAASSQPATARKPPARPDAKAKPKAKAKAKAILVCEDALRAARAVEALGERDVALEVVARAAQVKLGRAKALIVDLARNATEGLALAQQIDASDRPVHLFIAGVRDGEQARKLRELGSAESFRAAPGDGRVADAIAAALLA
jgi:predicted DNA-binding protein (MmcQ/YjbR family)